MKKIFYWSPHSSNVATIKNVINSAKSIKKFSKNDISVSIIDVIGEWKEYKDFLSLQKINLLNLPGLKLNKYFPITGFIKTRLTVLLICIFKFFSLKKILKSNKPNYLILHLVTTLPLIILLLTKSETKFVLRISGLPKLNLFRRFLWKCVANKLFLITCPSNQTRLDLIKLNIFPENKLKVLYDPILEISQISRDLKHKNYEIAKNKKYLLNVGRLTKQKNQIILIHAFSKILPKFNDLYLFIAGQGEDKQKLQREINTLKVNKNIFLIGHIENIYPLIKNAIAVVSPSLWEDPGAVMIESSYCQKAVISSNCPNGPEEFLSFGKGGYLFDNNSTEDLEKKLKVFLNDNKTQIHNKILLSKKNSRNYSIFNHYKQLRNYLNLS